MSRSIIMLSGGIDSAVALAWASQQNQELLALSFDYYRRPFRERLAIYRLLEKFAARLIEAPLNFLKEALDRNRSLAAEIPEGYISNRNLIFYSLATYFAEAENCETIVGGHTAEDPEAFPDSSLDFFETLQSLANKSLLMQKVKIVMPLAGMTKLQVLQKAFDWNVPLENTWSCYWDQTSPCLECVGCRERAEAFAQLGRKDPLL